MKDLLLDDQLPSLAVVIPCWNAERWIAHSIQSVLDQNYSNFEIIVIDDGSTDASLEIIRSFGEKISWQTGLNQGACIARNKGLATANSEYVLFLDADDWIEGDLLWSMGRAMLQNEVDILFAVCRMEWEGKIVAIMDLPEGADENKILECYLSGRVTQTGAILWRTDFLRAIGGWNILTLKRQDIELVLRALVGGSARARAISGGFVNWRQHESPARITRIVGQRPIQSEIAFYDSLLPHVGNFDRSLRTILGRKYYSLAAEAYYYKAYSLGNHALTQARRLEFRGHDGSTAERLIASAIGVRALQSLHRGRRALATSPMGPVARKLRAVKQRIASRSGSRA